MTRHRDVERVLRDTEIFSSRINADTMGPVMGTVILAMDGDEHRRYRNLVAGAFRPSALERWADELIRPTIHRLIDGLGATRARRPRGPGDRRNTPSQVIAGVLGVPFEDHELFHELGPGHQPRARGLPDLDGGVAPPARVPARPSSRTARPPGATTSSPTSSTPQVDGERLSDEHVYGFLLLLLPAGAETTFRAMGNCLLALLSHPDVLERVPRRPLAARPR